MREQSKIPSQRYSHKHVYVSQRPRCPVCNKVTYSHGGIHPQCSAEQEGKEFKAAEKAAREAGGM
jgi:hypothetical protein